MKIKSLCVKLVATTFVLGAATLLVACSSGEQPNANQPGIQTQAPVTQAPVTQYPVTQYPVTQYPVTQAPVTQYPVTQYPVTQYPVTQYPATQDTTIQTQMPSGTLEIPTVTDTQTVFVPESIVTDTVATETFTDIAIDTESDSGFVTETETETSPEPVTDNVTESESESATDPIIESETEAQTENPAHSMTVSKGLTFKKYGGAYYVSGVDESFKGSTLVVPAVCEVSGKEYPVTGIYTKAFYGNDKIKTVYLPDSVTKISSSAFEGAENLKSVYCGAGLVEIGASAFKNCGKLDEVTFGSSLTKVGKSAFEGCTNYKNVYINDIAAWCGINFADDMATPLYYADNLYIKGASGEYEILKNLVIPESVTAIGSRTFYACETLETVKLGNNIKSIGDSVFAECSSLTQINLPDGLESIGARAFAGCVGFTSFILPDSVTKLGEACFTRASKIAYVEIGPNMTSINRFTFYFCNSLVQVKYRGTPDQWKLVKSDSTCYLSTEVKSILCEYTDESGQVVTEKVATPKKGETQKDQNKK